MTCAKQIQRGCSHYIIKSELLAVIEENNSINLEKEPTMILQWLAFVKDYQRIGCTWCLFGT